MKKYVVRVMAQISDEIEVEAETDEEAIANAHADWSFVEAHSWDEEIIDREEVE